jgi:hypothetical protein
MEPRTPATRASWGGLDFSGPFVPIPWRGSFSESQFELIRLGAIPAEMEARWFAFFEDPELFVHRSWTGFCIYRVTFVQAADKHVVQTALVSDNRNRYRRKPDLEEVEFLDVLVDRLFLQEPSELTS